MVGRRFNFATMQQRIAATGWRGRLAALALLGGLLLLLGAAGGPVERQHPLLRGVEDVLGRLNDAKTSSAAALARQEGASEVLRIAGKTASSRELWLRKAATAALLEISLLTSGECLRVTPGALPVVFPARNFFRTALPARAGPTARC